MVGLLGIWLFGRIEGGVLDPITYLAEVEGPVVVVLCLLAGGGLAAAASRMTDPGAGSTGRASPSAIRPRPTSRAIVAVVDDWFGGRRVRHLVVRAWFRHVASTSWLAEDGAGQPIGFLIGYRSQDRPDEAILHLVAVHPSHRRRGIGRALVESFLADVGVAPEDGRGRDRHRARLARRADRDRLLPGPRVPARRRPRQPEPVRHTGLRRLRDAAARTGSSSAGGSILPPDGGTDGP